MGVSKILYGDKLDSNPFISSGMETNVNIPGKHKDEKKTLGLTTDLLSKHLLLLGGTGCGKTNTMYYIIEQLKSTMSKNDVMIIFDTKGDFYNRFYTERDIVISNSKQHSNITKYWNIYREAAADGWQDEDLILNSQEIAYSLFADAIEKTTNAFFPQAARDLFASILIQELRNGSRTDTGLGITPETYRKNLLNNEMLKDILNTLSVDSLKSTLFSQDLKSVFTYLGDGKNTQGLGVLAELQNITRQILVGSFAKQGSFSVRNFVRAKGARTLFVEYDLSIGSTLAPIYRLIFDLALKEAMGRTKSEGNVYFIFDEFKLLPNLKHIDDGVNFGRSLGVKVIAGLQSIRQLQEAYGEDRANNIISGFSSIFTYRMNDTISQKYITDLYGENYTIDEYMTFDNKIVEKERSGYCVENWDLNNLKTGDAIIGLCGERPFLFHFDQYKK